MATYLVNSTAAFGTGTLNDAIIFINSNANTIVTFSPDIVQTITLTQSLPIITNPFTFNGNGWTIDGNSNYSLLNINTVNQSDNVTINNLTFSNGSSTTITPGIYISNGTLNINTVSIDTCTANITEGISAASGILCDNNTILIANGLTIEYCNNIMNVNNNVVGCGIYMNGGSCNLSNSTFINNTISGIEGGSIDLAGGIVIDSSGQLSINNCTFIDNTCDISGFKGIIYSHTSNSNNNLTITDCEFKGNKAYDSGSIYYYGNEEMVVSNSSFEDNVSLMSGGAIFCQGPIHINNNTTFTNNSCSEYGGSLYIIPYDLTTFDGYINISSCVFTGVSDLNSSEISSNNGSFIYLPQPFNSTTSNGSISSVITNCQFSSGKSYSGGAIFMSSNVPLDNCSFTNCTSVNNGGAIVIGQNNNSNITDCTITECSSNSGGAIFCSNNSKGIIDVSISNCTAEFGGAIFCLDESNVTIESSTITNCIGNVEGGAFYIKENSSSNVQNTTIDSCSSPRGGAIYSNAQITFENIQIQNCSPTSSIITPLGIVVFVGANGNVEFTGTNTIIKNNTSVASMFHMENNDESNNSLSLKDTTIDSNTFINNMFDCNGINSHININEVTITNSIIGSGSSNNDNMFYSQGLMNIHKLDVSNTSTNAIIECTCLNIQASSILNLSYTKISNISNVILNYGISNCEYCHFSNYMNGVQCTNQLELSYSLLENGSQGFVGITQNSNTITLINSTINNNSTGISSTNASNLSINNCTITACDLGININIDSSLSMSSTLVDKNNIDVSGHVTSNGHNFIGKVGTSTGYTHTDILNEDSLLYPLSDNGGYTFTCAIPLESPCINNGLDNGLVYDQRGIPFSRTINITDIGAYENQNAVVCFTGDVQIKVKDIETKKIQILQIKEIINNKHLVYSEDTKSYVKIIHNIVSGTKKSFVLFAKDCISSNVPNSDLHTTGGHIVFINNVRMKARDAVKNGIGKFVNIDEQLIYSICTQKGDKIKANNMVTECFSVESWRLFRNSNRNVVWYDNK